MKIINQKIGWIQYFLLITNIKIYQIYYYAPNINVYIQYLIHL